MKFSDVFKKQSARVTLVLAQELCTGSGNTFSSVLHGSSVFSVFEIHNPHLPAEGN